MGLCPDEFERIFGLAQLADHVSVDLWHYRTPNGKSLKRAFQWMIPDVSGTKDWEYQQIESIHWGGFLSLAVMADSKYNDLELQQLIDKLKKEKHTHYNPMSVA